jgi:hypothetical protein
MSLAERVAMIDRVRVDLSVRRQCALLGLVRSGVCTSPRRWILKSWRGSC